MTSPAELTPGEHARRVIAQTASAWKIAPTSARATARRAPHGYVPMRIMRRIQKAAVAYSRPALAHSW